jgi:hypothetical protein
MSNLIVSTPHLHELFWKAELLVEVQHSKTTAPSFSGYFDVHNDWHYTKRLHAYGTTVEKAVTLVKRKACKLLEYDQKLIKDRVEREERKRYAAFDPVKDCTCD